MHFFPGRAGAQGSLCPVGPLGPPPGVGANGVGGLEYRKNTVVLNRRLKNTCVFALWPLSGCPWESWFYAYLCRFSPVWDVFGKAWRADPMHICVVSACLGCLWQTPGEQFLCIFTSFQFCLRCLVEGLKRWLHAYLWVFVAIYVVLALFGMSLGRHGEQLVCIFAPFQHV